MIIIRVMAMTDDGGQHSGMNITDVAGTDARVDYNVTMDTAEGAPGNATDDGGVSSSRRFPERLLQLLASFRLECQKKMTSDAPTDIGRCPSVCVTSF